MSTKWLGPGKPTTSAARCKPKASASRSFPNADEAREPSSDQDRGAS